MLIIKNQKVKVLLLVCKETAGCHSAISTSGLMTRSKYSLGGMEGGGHCGRVVTLSPDSWDRSSNSGSTSSGKAGSLLSICHSLNKWVLRWLLKPFIVSWALTVSGILFDSTDFYPILQSNSMLVWHNCVCTTVFICINTLEARCIGEATIRDKKKSTLEPSGNGQYWTLIAWDLSCQHV